MKKFLLIIMLLVTEICHAGLSAYFSYSVFNQPGVSPYVETYLNVAGNSVALAATKEGTYQGKIEIQWIYRQGDSIVHFDKYNLLSPESSSKDGLSKDFIDQQRVPLKEGDYILELNIQDKNSDHPAFRASQKIHVKFPSEKISVSDIELLESFSPSVEKGKFSKSGYDVIPMVTAFYPKEISTLKFYAEIYNAKKVLNEEYLLRYSIAYSGNNKILNEYASMKKQSPEDVTVLMAEIPIEHLYSGNYYLSIEAFNKRNELLAFRQVFFQRSNSAAKPLATSDPYAMDVRNTFASQYREEDSLKEYISCLYPISSKLEAQIAENIINLRDLDKMQSYFYNFWANKNPENPEAAWISYKLEVDKVNGSFASRNKKGYETDRGRVYLQYGPPNSITSDEMDPTARPYTIWHYYRLDHQTNRKFVFYSLGNSSNDYQLIHSDAQGELQDPAWELKLHNRTQQFGNDMDQEKAIDVYGSKTKENFRDPK